MNRTIIGYRMLEYRATKDLSDAVCQLIGEGWQPYGSPALFMYEYQAYLVQAMVKYKPEVRMPSIRVG